MILGKLVTEKSLKYYNSKVKKSFDDLRQTREITLSNTTATKFSVTLQGITATDTPTLSVKTTQLATMEEKQSAIKEWNKVIEANTVTNAIEFTLNKPLSKAIVVLVKGE